MRRCRPLDDRLWAKMHRTPTGCWEFTGATTVGGYGQLHIGGSIDRKIGAHRAAWEVTHGPVPDGLLVRHKCDNRLCINPDHLELGTPADNSADMVLRDRSGKRLSTAQVAEIRAARAAGEPRKAVAERFGISVNYVTDLTRQRFRPARQAEAS